jgi:YggT family protein
VRRRHEGPSNKSASSFRAALSLEIATGKIMALRRSLLLALVALSAAAAHVTPLPAAPRRKGAHTGGPMLAYAIPGDSLAEDVLVGGSLNFLSLYSGLLGFRILLTWFPQAQGIGALRPIFNVCDVYLNLFRGIAVLGGIDFGPIAAFFVLNLLTSSVASLGAPMAAAEPPASATPQQRREHARRVAFAPALREGRLGERLAAARRSFASAM